MSGRPEVLEEVRRWVEKAEHDLMAAEAVQMAREVREAVRPLLPQAVLAEEK